MTGRREKKVYGDPIASLKSLLDNLRLKYKEHGRGQPGTSHIVEIPDFGILIHVAVSTNTIQEPTTSGLIKIKYNTDFSIPEAEKFGEDLMWILVDRGYMAYIREHPHGGNERIFNMLIKDGGWGQKILDKRLSDWENRPDRRFLFARLKKLYNTFGMSEILSRFPGFFDFLS